MQHADQAPSPYRPELVNYEAEMALLAAILASNDVFWKVRAFLRPEHFADALHGRIFEVIAKLADRGEVANVLTLKQHLGDDAALNSAGGARYLVRIANDSLVTILGADDFGRQVFDLARKRRFYELLDDATSRVANVDLGADQLIAHTVAGLQHLAEGGCNRTLAKRDVARAIADDLTRAPQVHSTGLPSVDRAMGGGLFAGKTYGVGARKKRGKTVLLGTISDSLNQAGVSHTFFAHEMTPKQIEQRSIARHLGINPMAFLRGMNTDLASRVAQFAENMPSHMHYAKAAGKTLDQVKEIISADIVQHKIRGVILDYWQLVRGRQKHESEEQHLSNVAQGLADFCLEHNVWLLIAAQLNQQGNSRGSEGIKMACDQYYTLQRDPVGTEAALVMEDTRYTPYRDVGAYDSERDLVTTAGLIFNRNGPFFEDAAGTAPLPWDGE